MPAGLTVDQIDDLTTSTLRNLQKGNLAQMAQTMQSTEILSKWFTRDKVVKKGGYGIEHRVLNNLPTTSRFITIDETDNPSIPKLLDKLTIPWRHHEDSYAWYLEEILMNSGESEIVDLLSARRDATKIKTTEVMENAAWSAPSSSSDTLAPWGVPLYMPDDTSLTSGGFSTALPSGFSDIAGIVPSASNGWTHYGDVYSAISSSDLVYRIRRAMAQTNFVSPVGKEDFYGMKGKNWRLYCGLTTWLAFSDVADGRNENLGPDLAKMDGVTVINGNPIIRSVPLDNATYTPIYGLNHNTWRVFVLKGAFFRESPAIVMPNNHRGRFVPTDCTFNFGCINRRHNFKIHKAA